MKPFGVPLTLACLVSSIVWLIVEGGGPAIVLIVLHAQILFAWLLVIHPTWVRRQGDKYAERLVAESRHRPVLTSTFPSGP